jgi:ABC-type glutathione transport system ATPase component
MQGRTIVGRASSYPAPADVPFAQILITHHITLCLSGSDYLVQMLGGRIALQGPVDELDKSAITSELVEEPVEEEDVDAVAEVALEPSPVTIEASAEAPTAEALAATSEDNKLVKEEARATGRVKILVYRTYLAAGGWWTWLFIILFSISGRFGRGFLDP